LESRGHKLLFFATFIFELKAKYQLEVSENKVVSFFFPLEFTDPRNLFTNPQRVHVPRLWTAVLGYPGKNRFQWLWSRVKPGSRLLSTWHKQYFWDSADKNENNRVICSVQEQW